VDKANKIVNDAGLHGKTIVPKNNPKINELNIGDFVTGALTLGSNLLKSKLNINNRLITAKIPKAIGEIIPIALDKEACKNFVKINPNTNIDRITPNATTNPNNIIVFLDSFPDNLFDKYARKPGYKGKTHTAPSGANIPAKNESHKFNNTLTILTTSQFLF